MPPEVASMRIELSEVRAEEALGGGADGDDDLVVLVGVPSI